MGAGASYQRDKFYGDKPPFCRIDESTRDKHEGIGPIIYHHTCQDKKNGSFKLRTAPEFGEKTLMDVVVNTSKRFAGQRVVGFRKLEKVHQVEENGRTFEKLQFENKYTWMSWETYAK